MARRDEADLDKILDAKLAEVHASITNVVEDNSLKDEQINSIKERTCSVREEMLSVAKENVSMRRKVAKLRYQIKQTKEHGKDHAVTRLLDERSTQKKIDGLLDGIDEALSTIARSVATDLPGNSMKQEKDTNDQIVGPYVTVSFDSDQSKVFYIAKATTFGELLGEVRKFYLVPESDFFFLVDNTGVVCPSNQSIRKFCNDSYGQSWLEKEVKLFVLRSKNNEFRNHDLSSHGQGQKLAERKRILNRTKRLAQEKNPFHDAWIKSMFQNRKQYMHAFVTFLAFVVMFVLTAIYRRDVSAERQAYASVEQAIKRPVGVFGGKQFDNIEIEDDFWAWMQGPFRDMLFPDTFYNGAPVPPSLLGQMSMYNRMAGALRLRQLRVQNHECSSRVIDAVDDWFGSCNAPYSKRNRLSDRTQKASEWLSLPTGHGATKIPMPTYFEGSPPETIWGGGGDLFGRSVVYDDSGWIIDVNVTDFDRESWSLSLRQMRQGKYIDTRTRAVVVDFNVYVSNINTFIATVVLFEFTAGGAVLPTLKIKPWFRSNYDDTNQWTGLFMEFLLLLFNVYYFWSEWQRYVSYVQTRRGHPHYATVYGSTFKFLSSFWNALEVCILGVYIGALVCRFQMYFDPVRLKPLPWSNHEDLFVRGEMYSMAFKLDGVLTLLVLTKSLKFAGLNPSFNLMRLTIISSAPVVLTFGTIFGIFFVAFVLVGHSIFGSEMYDFSTLTLAFRTCLFMLVGDLKYSELQDISPVWAPVFTISFVFLMSFICINVFLATMAYVYEKLRKVHFVKYDETERENRSKFIWDRDETKFTVSCWDLVVTIAPVVSDIHAMFSGERKKEEYS